MPTPGAERPVAALTVALTVGKVRREILVFGDEPGRRTARPPSRPTPFTKDAADLFPRLWRTVPINWTRNLSSICPTPATSMASGSDAERMARELGGLLKAPPGYPTLPAGYVRRLPNLEDPRAPIAPLEDAPLPRGWATVPIDAPIWAARQARGKPQATASVAARRNQARIAHCRQLSRPP